jgi:hypothetical protein
MKILKEEEEFIIKTVDSYPYRGDLELKSSFQSRELF